MTNDPSDPTRRQLGLALFGGCSLMLAFVALVGGTFLYKAGKTRIEARDAIMRNTNSFLGAVRDHRYDDAARLMVKQDATGGEPAGIRRQEEPIEKRIGPLLDWKLVKTAQADGERDHVTEGQATLTFTLRYARGRGTAMFGFESKDPLNPEVKIAGVALHDGSAAPSAH
jgi:hypothetical protein